MRIITCASYFATGSSAVTDLFSEFEGVLSFDRYEYRILQDPDGISDLEYNIVENNHRHNTSHAIKRFIALTKSFDSFGYGKKYPLYCGNFKQITEQYVNEITELQTKTWWFRDRIDRGNLFCIIDRAYSLVKRIFTNGMHNERKYSMLAGKEDAFYSAIDEQSFLLATRKYIDSIVNQGNPDQMEYVMVDQMVPPTNCNRYARYFNDVRIIVVDRDPRDVYLWEKTRINWGVIPTRTVEEYVKWFLITRKYSKCEDEDRQRILRIKFEDLIYRYDDTVKVLCDFVGLPLEKHLNPLSKLVPEKSKNNTNLKTKIQGYEKDIEYIEEKLKDYLYDFNE